MLDTFEMVAVPARLKLGCFRVGIRFSHRNDYELEIIYDDIFAGIYISLRPRTTEPSIIDCGGHIGLAVLYFKSVSPRAKILTFEPNPETFFLLRENIVQNNLGGVRAINMVVSSEDTGAAILYVGNTFLQAWDSTNTTNTDLWPNMDQYRSTCVRSKRLSSYMNNRVEFIKLDIEGAEYDVLDEVKAKLSVVGVITLEYHQSAANLFERKLEKVIEILFRRGFRYELLYEAKPVGLDAERFGLPTYYWGCQ